MTASGVPEAADLDLADINAGLDDLRAGQAEIG